MSLFRRNTSSKANGKLTRLFFASDFHGSQRIFRKFINAAKHYEAHVLVMGGDVVGKLAIPVIREANGGFRAHLMGKTERLEGADDLQRFEDRLGTLGYYSKIMDDDEYQALRSDSPWPSIACSTSLPANGLPLGSIWPRRGSRGAESNVS